MQPCRPPIWEDRPMLRVDSVGAGYGRAQVLRDVSLDVG